MKLIDIVETFISGDWGSETCTDEEGVKVHCLRSADIVPIYQFDYDNIPCRYVSQRSHDSRELQEGDIVIEKSGGTNNCSTGRPIYVSNELLENNKPLLCSNFCEAFRVKKGWSSRYIYYYIKLVHKSNIFFNFEGKTSGIHNLDIDSAFKAIEIPDISYKQQVKIATTIQNIECKISQNRKLNSVLENMAKQLYDYWFVQFDFPNSEGSPYKLSGGKMVYNDSLKMFIPEGWEAKFLTDITSRVKVGFVGTVDKYYCKPEDGYKIIRPSEMSKVGIDYINSRSITKEFFDANKKSQLHKGDILISRNDLEGTPNRHELDMDVQVLNAVIIEPNEDMASSALVCEIIKSQYVNSQIRNFFSGSTLSVLNTEMVGKLKFAYNKECCHKIKDKLETIYSKVESNREEIRILMSLRDYLLPLLINGQVTIKEDNQI